MALQSLKGPWPPHNGGFVILLRHLVGLLWKSDQPVAKASSHIERQNADTQRQNTHASSGIRTHDRSDKAATGTGKPININKKYDVDKNDALFLLRQ
jgi:hypothetical protein